MLDYEANLPRYQSTPEDRRWRIRRLSYYLGHLVVLALIGYGPGANLRLFHSLFSPTSAYYATIAQQRFTPAIAAIKAYQRDNGSLPMDTYELEGTYLPKADGESKFDTHGAILGTTSVTFMLAEQYSVVEYEFTPAREGWFVYAPRYYGPLPAPIVAPSPITRPAITRPTNANN